MSKSKASSQKTEAAQPNGTKKTECKITRAFFEKEAKPLQITINGVPMLAEVKQFSTGSFGWYLNGKTNVEVGGDAVSVQIGLNLTVVGSKEVQE